MNRGVFESSLVQQMMGGSPTWWNMNNLRPPAQQTSFLLPSSSTSSSSSSSSSVFPQDSQPSNFLPMISWHDNQYLPESWSQLLLGGLMEEEGRCSFTPFRAKSSVDNWEDQVLYPSASTQMVDVKQETSEGGYLYSHGNEEIQAPRSPWSQVLPTSSPRSCITNFSRNMLDFSSTKAEKKHLHPDHSSECNSTTGAAFKKARVQASSAQSPFKVRKEKLGDRITALHQLVSPFGKTDTASVLLEAIGYIRFLQSQIEALSSPYLGSGTRNMRQSDADDEPKKDLRSRGLCLVPVSFTLHVGGDNGADYWAPTFGGGFR
ncbi:transcription factor bHLH68 [Elaeis guineensis]|uniref:Transcription factor bHLH68 n=1 Tax=Elaeis guineensis var. tenera TaxID=51953 RepID=A0A6I9R4Y8_ELAGV|nr:transcription factor bHLH68 [Elaeis guineensis]